MVSAVGIYPSRQVEIRSVAIIQVRALAKQTAPVKARAAGSEEKGISLSPLARQLASSATRAEARDRLLSRDELAKKAKHTLNQIIGNAYNKAKADQEVPDTDDPALLARAKQATAFLHSSDNGSRHEPNPFAGLSREQLANIIYDDSGAYTLNERRAAFYEAYEQEQAWRAKVIEQAEMEYRTTGKQTCFFQAVLEHYKGLPAIEQAQYPAGYAADLANKIQLDFTAEGSQGKDYKNLIEMLLDKNFGVAQPSATEI